jgi:hypothetical protein
MEKIRVQNAQVLRARLAELVEQNEFIDFVLAGDFNSDYNQKQRYGFSPSAINDVLKSGGNEVGFIKKNGKEVYNLWYEIPNDQRGSDTYRGYWGTLMQLIVSKGMYDKRGVSYVDNSFERGDFGFNTYSSSGEPKRWSSTFSGSGYSDHLPVSMRIRISDGKDRVLYPPIVEHGEWQEIPVAYSIPSEFLTNTEFSEGDPTKNPDFYDEYFYLSATVNDKYDFVINGKTYDVYTPSFRLNEVLSDIKGTEKEIKFYGRFSQYRGSWQFIVESPEFLIIE